MAGPDDTAVFNVAIRTAVLDAETGTMGVGSGIVWDSEPEAEYEECALKGEFLTADTSTQQAEDADDFKLIETMRYDGGRISLLDRHVERLARSAKYFSFPFDEERFRARLEAGVSSGDAAPTCKVRATQDRWGRVEVTLAPISSGKNEPWRLVVVDERADRSDSFFYHKTTWRRVYKRALDAARKVGGDEALLRNQDGEVTEGTYSSLFVRRGEALYTPPVASGLLAGVYRRYVLDTHPQAKEQVLTLEDLESADALYCCNAVRGWCEAELFEASMAPSES